MDCSNKELNSNKNKLGGKKLFHEKNFEEDIKDEELLSIKNKKKKLFANTKLINHNINENEEELESADDLLRDILELSKKEK